MSQEITLESKSKEKENQEEEQESEEDQNQSKEEEEEEIEIEEEPKEKKLKSGNEEKKSSIKRRKSLYEGFDEKQDLFRPEYRFDVQDPLKEKMWALMDTYLKSPRSIKRKNVGFNGYLFKKR